MIFFVFFLLKNVSNVGDWKIDVLRLRFSSSCSVITLVVNEPILASPRQVQGTRKTKTHQASIHARASAALVLVIVVAGAVEEEAATARRGRGAAAGAAAVGGDFDRLNSFFGGGSEEAIQRRLSRGGGAEELSRGGGAEEGVPCRVPNRRGRARKRQVGARARLTRETKKERPSSIVGDNEKRLLF